MHFFGVVQSPSFLLWGNPDTRIHHQEDLQISEDPHDSKSAPSLFFFLFKKNISHPSKLFLLEDRGTVGDLV